VSVLVALVSNIILLDELLFKLGSGKGSVDSLGVSEVLTFYCCYSSKGG